LDVLETCEPAWNELRDNRRYRMRKEGRLGEIKGVYHRIDTGSAAPVHAQPYRAGPAARKAEKAVVKRC
jgi:hypothetical protein